MVVIKPITTWAAGAEPCWGVQVASAQDASELCPLRAKELEYLNANSYINWLRAAPRRHQFPGTSDLPCMLEIRAGSRGQRKCPETPVLAAGRGPVCPETGKKGPGAEGGASPASAPVSTHSG